jgi:hypothetical protein
MFSARSGVRRADSPSAHAVRLGRRQRRRRARAPARAALCGTAFAFVHWLEALEQRSLRLALPAGTRVMETGGFKGRAREMPRCLA